MDYVQLVQEVQLYLQPAYSVCFILSHNIDMIIANLRSPPQKNEAWLHRWEAINLMMHDYSNAVAKVNCVLQQHTVDATVRNYMDKIETFDVKLRCIVIRKKQELKLKCTN